MKTISLKFWATLLLFSMLQFSGARPARAFTVGEERELGEILLFQTRLAFTLLDDPDIAQYINELGKDVLQAAGSQYFDYHFFVIKNNEFNAFAAPSGLLFFYSGLIETMNSEDELVSVMAHEVGHVVSRHIASRMEKGMKTSVATMALAIAGLALGAGAVSQALVTGSMAANQAINLHFSRQDEEEADLLSYGWMKQMGRNPVAMEKMLKAMRRITRYRMDQVPQYLLTHPDPEARLGYIQSLMAIEKTAGASLYPPVDNFAFLRFKYRVLSQLEDEGQFRNFLVSRMTDAQAAPLEQTMAKYGLALVEYEAGNFAQSRQLLEEVATALPDRSILLVDQGRLELALGNKDAAFKLFTSACAKNRDDLWALYQLAMAQIVVGKEKEAEENLMTVAREIPEYSRVYYEIGKLRANQGRQVEASYYLGKYYLYEGRIELAKENFERVAKDRYLSAVMLDDTRAMLETIERLEKGPGSKKKQEEEKKRKEEEEAQRIRRPRPLPFQ